MHLYINRAFLSNIKIVCKTFIFLLYIKFINIQTSLLSKMLSLPSYFFLTKLIFKQQVNDFPHVKPIEKNNVQNNIKYVTCSNYRFLHVPQNPRFQ